MNTMHIPGFTAEASLYTTEERYRWAYFSTSVTDRGIVLPQFFYTNVEGENVFCGCIGGTCWCTTVRPIFYE